MKYKLLLPAILCLSLRTAAQNTGIGTNSPTDQLHTTGTVRFEGYRGPGTRLVQLDSSGRMIVTGAGAVFTAYPAAAITDNGCAAGTGVSSTITVSGLPTSVASAKIAVRVNITHTYDGDLRILLVSPGGAILSLAYGAGSNGHNFTNTVFSDAASNSLSAGSAPFTGKYRPAGNTGAQCTITPTVATFSAIGGGTINPNGLWTLKVFDAATGDVGTLNKWDISCSGPESFTTAEQNNYIPKFDAGNLDPSNIYQDPATGNVSIGTSAVLYPLSVYGTGAGIVQYDPGYGVNVGTYTNVYGGGLQTYNNNALTFATNAAAAPQLMLSTAGNLGIGLTSNFLARLHVVAGGAAVAQLENSTALATGITTDLTFKTGSYFTGIIRTRGLSGNAAALGFYTYASPNAGTLTERLTILDQGNVGIGNTAPGYNLDVTGTLRATGNTALQGTLAVTGNTTVQGALQTGGTLTVNSNTIHNGAVRIADGTQGADRILSSDAAGNASWKAPANTGSGFQARIGGTGQTVTVPLTFSNPGGAVPMAISGTGAFDDGPNFNGSTYQYVAPSAGVYTFSGCIDYYVNAAGSTSSLYVAPADLLISVMIAVNGLTRGTASNNILSGQKVNGSASVSTVVRLAAGDVVSLNVYQVGLVNSGSQPAINVMFNYFGTHFSGARLY